MDAAAPASTPRPELPTAAIGASSPVDTPVPWPRSAQAAAAGLMALTVLLLGWHAWALQRGPTRPTDLEAGPVLDLNRADPAQLVQLPGVGPGLAQRIDQYRREHQGFHRVEELRQVRGIGPVLLEQLRPLVWVGPPASGEEAPASATPAGPEQEPAKAAPTRGGRARKAGPAELVDINEASAAQLQELPRIGPQLAARIVEARRERPFAAVDDLRRVPGIGSKTLAVLRPHVRIRAPTPTPLADLRSEHP